MVRKYSNQYIYMYVCLEDLVWNNNSNLISEAQAHKMAKMDISMMIIFILIETVPTWVETSA